MIGARVESLRYRIEPAEEVSYTDPPAVDLELAEFVCRLESGVLTCTPRRELSSVQAARETLEPLLRSWQLGAALDRGRPEFSFVFESARVVEAPGEGEDRPVTVHHLGETVTLSSKTSLRIRKTQYPAFPDTFRTSPDVETLWQRYQGYLRGREPLASMAYFCYTVVGALFRGRDRAADELQVDLAVLRKLSELTSTRGDAATARKAESKGPVRAAERAWIETAVRALIRRLGEYQAGGTFGRITMADLPPL